MVTAQAIDVFLSQVDLPISGYSLSALGCVDADNLASYRNVVLFDSFFPNVEFNDNATESFDAVRIADVADLTQSDIDSIAQDINQHVVVGACIAEVQYQSSAGEFYTYAVVMDDQVVFEAMQYLIPVVEERCDVEDMSDSTRLLRASRFMLEDQYEKQAQSGRCVWVDSWIDVMEFNCFVTADCREKEALACSGTPLANSLFLGWEANGIKDVIKVGTDCCRNTCTFGWAFGFKSVKISVDPVSIEIEGILGAGGKFGKTVKACCDRECPSASPSTKPSADPTDSPAPSPGPSSLPSYSLPSASPTESPVPSPSPTGSPTGDVGASAVPTPSDPSGETTRASSRISSLTEGPKLPRPLS